MDERTKLRVRAFVSSWITVVLVVALAVAGIGVWATYTTHVDPGITTEQRSTTVWSTATRLDHSATVTRENPLYATGTVLSNRSTYFKQIAPVLDGRFTVRPRGLSEDVSVNLSARLSLQAADEQRTYWSDTQPLNQVSVQTAGSDPVSVDFSVNISTVEARIAQIQQSIGATPGETSAAVIIDARVEGVTDDGPSRTSFSRRLALSISGDTYSITSPGESTEQVQRTQAVTVPREYGPIRSIGGPLALLAGLATLGALGYGRRNVDMDLSDRERERLAYLRDRAEFDEWIVSVRLPSDETNRPVAVAESLADLVDLAVDANTSVIEEPSGGRFHVVTAEYHYTYEPPGSQLGETGTERPATTDRMTPFEAPGDAHNAHNGDGSDSEDAGIDGPTSNGDESQQTDAVDQEDGYEGEPSERLED